MEIHKMLDKHSFVLSEAVIIESLRRSGDIALHPRLENALLIYDSTGQSALNNLYQNFLAIAHKGGIPMTICTPIWRCNHDRISRARVTNDAYLHMKKPKRQILYSKRFMQKYLRENFSLGTQMNKHGHENVTKKMFKS